MRLLLVVDDSVTQKELLKQISHNFDLRSKSKNSAELFATGDKSHWKSERPVMKKQKLNQKYVSRSKSDVLAPSFQISDPEENISLSSMAEPLHVHQPAKYGVLKKIHGGSEKLLNDNGQDNVHGKNVHNSSDSRRRRKRKISEVEEEARGKDQPEATKRKRSSEILKEKLKRIHSCNSRHRLAASDADLPVAGGLDDGYLGDVSVSVMNDGHRSLTASCVSSAGDDVTLRRNESQDTSNFTCHQTHKNNRRTSGDGEQSGTPRSRGIRLKKLDKGRKSITEQTLICIGKKEKSKTMKEKSISSKRDIIITTNNNHIQDGCGLAESYNLSCHSSGCDASSRSTISDSKRLVQDQNDTFCLSGIFDSGAVVPVDEDKPGFTDSQSSCHTETNSKAVQDIPDWMYVALDCEMVGVGPRGKHSALARCSIVDYDGNVIYDKYVRPNETITDYRTPWSGIRPAHMMTAVPVHEALKNIKECLAHKIVIGHAVYHDFKVLQISPDHHLVRDTAQCRQLVEMAELQGRGNSLKKLSQALLNRSIQTGRSGHCSVEDARATLDLFKLVRHTWEQDLYSKWSKKGADIVKKVATFIEAGTKHRDLSCSEDFLNDKFWPSHIMD